MSSVSSPESQETPPSASCRVNPSALSTGSNWLTAAGRSSTVMPRWSRSATRQVYVRRSPSPPAWRPVPFGNGAERGILRSAAELAGAARAYVTMLGVGPSVLLQFLGEHHEDAAGTADVRELVDVFVVRHAAQRPAAVLRGDLQGFVDVVD